MPTPARSSGCGARSATRPSMCRPRRGGGGAGGARGGANACGASSPVPPLDTDGQRLTAVRRSGARRQGLERRAGLRGRPSESQGAGLYAGREVRDADVHQPVRAATAVGGRSLRLPRDAQQEFLYVADYGNSRIAVLDWRSLQLLYQFGQRSEKPGDFQGLHHLAIDSKGNLYTGEVAPGARAQRFGFKGLSNTMPPNAITPFIPPAPPLRPRAPPRAFPPPGQARGGYPPWTGHHGESVPRDSQLAATRRHQARRGDRHHP